MGRTERRAAERHRQKLSKEVIKLTPNQLKLVDEITEHKVNEALDVFKELVTNAVFKTMRENKIGEERANKIISESDLQIREWLKDKKEVN